MANLTSIIKQYRDLKSKHPDAVLLFRVGDFYKAYEEDADVVGKVCSVNVERKEATHIKVAKFVYHSLDIYLPKLIRAGHRIAICDQLEAPKRGVGTENKNIR